jgi:hypothetical protein
LSPTQSTASATGAHVPGSVMSESDDTDEAGRSSGCE